jgi:hypothetical protein
MAVLTSRSWTSAVEVWKLDQVAAVEVGNWTASGLGVRLTRHHGKRNRDGRHRDATAAFAQGEGRLQRRRGIARRGAVYVGGSNEPTVGTSSGWKPWSSADNEGSKRTIAAGSTTSATISATKINFRCLDIRTRRGRPRWCSLGQAAWTNSRQVARDVDFNQNRCTNNIQSANGQVTARCPDI